MHGEVVDGGAAGFGDIFGARAGLVVEKGGDVADFDLFFEANFDNGVTRGHRSNDGIEVAVDANFGAFGGGARPAIGVADGNGGDPDVVFRHVGAVVAGAVALAELFDVNNAGFKTDGGTKVENIRVAKFIFGVNAVDGHSGANQVEKSVGVLEEAEAGGGVLFSKGDAFIFERRARFIEAAELLFVEVGIFGERHHGSLDADGFASGEIAHERSGLMIRHADAADAGVNTDMEGNGPLRFGGNFVESRTEGGVNHGKDVADHGVGEVLLVEGAEKKDGFANAGVAEGEGFVEFYDGEAEYFGLRFEKLRDVYHTHAVAVVFDDGENRASGNAEGDFGNIVAEVFVMDFDPGVEGGIQRRSGLRQRRSGEI